jgi:hypothetical protein
MLYLSSFFKTTKLHIMGVYILVFYYCLFFLFTPSWYGLSRWSRDLLAFVVGELSGVRRWSVIVVVVVWAVGRPCPAGGGISVLCTGGASSDGFS